MKHFSIIFSILFLVILLCVGCSADTDANKTPDDTFNKQHTSNTETNNTEEDANVPNTDTTVLNYDDFKAIWLSQFDLNAIYTSNGKQREITDYTTKIRTVLSQVSELGFNTIIVQVRPYADSFYPSEYYPPSKYVTGSYSNNFEYDPISIIIEEAHKLELSVHGWINPLRGMTTDEIKSVSDKYIIKQWYNDSATNTTYIVEYNGRYYLNPAYKETRALIVSGVQEMLNTYSFDGIHMDDYFYPTADKSFDNIAYTEYTASTQVSLKEFRYTNLNTLISDIYSAVKSKNNNILFGISPEGNMNNATEKAFADVYTWCSKDGYIDYICPQIYFGFEHQTYPFDKTATQWQNIIKTDSVKLIIGVTLGKAHSKTDNWAGTGKNEWAENTDILKRSVEYTQQLKKCTGIAMFCYQYFYNPSTLQEVTDAQEEINNLLPALKEATWK